MRVTNPIMIPSASRSSCSLRGKLTRTVSYRLVSSLLPRAEENRVWKVSKRL